MEFRNVIFAIALSFAVLFGWSVIFETPKIEEQKKLDQNENPKNMPLWIVQCGRVNQLIRRAIPPYSLGKHNR